MLLKRRKLFLPVLTIAASSTLLVGCNDSDDDTADLDDQLQTLIAANNFNR